MCAQPQRPSSLVLQKSMTHLLTVQKEATLITSFTKIHCQIPVFLCLPQLQYSSCVTILDVASYRVCSRHNILMTRFATIYCSVHILYYIFLHHHAKLTHFMLKTSSGQAT